MVEVNANLVTCRVVPKYSSSDMSATRSRLFKCHLHHHSLNKMVELTIELTEKDVEAIQHHGKAEVNRATQAVLDAVAALNLRPMHQRGTSPLISGSSPTAIDLDTGVRSDAPCSDNCHRLLEFVVMRLCSGYVTVSIGLRTTVAELKAEVIKKIDGSKGPIHLAWRGKELELDDMPVLETVSVSRKFLLKADSF